jgi:hypothetical protein
MNEEKAQGGWARQSAVTDPGAAAGAIDALPAELSGAARGELAAGVSLPRGR